MDNLINPVDNFMPEGQGRFLTLNSDVIKKIVAEIEGGAPFHYAYMLSGIVKCTGEAWRGKGFKAIRNGEENEYTDLVHAMDAAKARYLRTIWKRMSKAGDNPLCWQADGEILARRCPESFSKNAGVEGEYHDPDLTLAEQSAKIVKDIDLGKISSEEGMRRSQVIQMLAQAQYDAMMEPLREKLLPIFKQMEGK